MQEIEHGRRDVVPADLASVIEGALQVEGGHVPEGHGALEPCDIVRAKARLRAEPTQILVREKKDKERDPISQKEPGPPQHQGGDEHEQQQALGRYREVKDEDHEEGDGRQVEPHQARKQQRPAASRRTLRRDDWRHGPSLVEPPRRTPA